MIRNYKPGDLERVLAINDANQPEVGPLDEEKLTFLVSEGPLTRVVVSDGQVEGFLILLQEGSTYRSPNYGWFSERYSTFAYVDRIALTPAVRGSGWGVDFYEQAVQFARTKKKIVLAAEVNTVPPNPRSTRFHEKFGFVEIGRERPYGPDEEVAMLAYPI